MFSYGNHLAALMFPCLAHVSINHLSVLMFPCLMTNVSILDVGFLLDSHFHRRLPAHRRNQESSSERLASSRRHPLRRHAAPRPMMALDAATSDANGPQTSLHIAPSPERRHQEPSSEVAAPCILPTAPPPTTRLPPMPTALEA